MKQHTRGREIFPLCLYLSLRCLSEITSKAANPRLALLNFISSEEHKLTRVKDDRCMKTNLACDRLLLPHQLLPVLLLLLLLQSPPSSSCFYIATQSAPLPATTSDAHRGRKVEAMSSECSSGCQSGWTTYFVHSSDEKNSLCREDGESFRRIEEVEEEEDLSMVSDASSGPQHFNEVNGNGYCYLYSALLPADGGKKKRALVEPQQIKHSSLLDDTASSHLLTNSKNSFTDCNYQMKESMEEILDFSYDFSTTQFQANSNLRMQMGHSQSSARVKPNGTRPGSRKKGRKM